MGKRKPVSILKRAQGPSAGLGKKRRTELAGDQEQQQTPQKQPRKQPLNGNSAGAGGSSGQQQRRQQRQPEPLGLRPTSPVHSQAAYAVRRLLEADASKRGGVTLKSLTLAPHITAKKVRSGHGQLLLSLALVCKPPVSQQEAQGGQPGCAGVRCCTYMRRPLLPQRVRPRCRPPMRSPARCSSTCPCFSSCWRPPSWWSRGVG